MENNTTNYNRLVLDPRCLKPKSIIKNNKIYNDALNAICVALITLEHISVSERSILENLQTEIKKNQML